MGKTQIIIIGVAGLISFGTAFGITSFIKKSRPVVETGTVEDNQTESSPVPHLPADNVIAEASFGGGGSGLPKSMLEKQLRGLIFDIREKMKDHKSRERELAETEQRIATARKTLLEDIDRLSKLRDQVNTRIADLKTRQESLKKSLIEIDSVEKANLVQIAATYDRMDVTQAAKIIITMASNRQLNDAVKIIHLMSERTAAKLLGEIAQTQPELSCLLSTELKKVRESE